MHQRSGDDSSSTAPVADAVPTLRVLWIDDQATDTLVRLLSFDAIAVDVAYTGAEGLRRALEESHDVILLDPKLEDMFGGTVLRRLRACGVVTPVVVMTGCYFEEELVADVHQHGAAAVLYRVVDDDRLVPTLRSAASSPALQSSCDAPLGVIAASPAMRDVLRWVERSAASTLPALVMGETGTGKEVVASAIHRASSRRGGPFVPVNCGALPEAVRERAVRPLQGRIHGRGAAHRWPRRAAAGGTLFLDEIGELPLPMQVRLLRFLDDGKVRRVGETRERAVDVRVIAATNRSLLAEADAGRFRWDLYYRLAATHTVIPPLRERPEDVDALARWWLARPGRRPSANAGDFAGGAGDAAIASMARECARASQRPGTRRVRRCRRSGDRP